MHSCKICNMQNTLFSKTFLKNKTKQYCFSLIWMFLWWWETKIEIKIKIQLTHQPYLQLHLYLRDACLSAPPSITDATQVTVLSVSDRLRGNSYTFFFLFSFFGFSDKGALQHGTLTDAHETLEKQRRRGEHNLCRYIHFLQIIDYSREIFHLRLT